MMAEILTESKLTDEKRLLEILEMLKSRLLMRFQSAGHTTAVFTGHGLCVSVGQIKRSDRRHRILPGRFPGSQITMKKKKKIWSGSLALWQNGCSARTI